MQTHDVMARCISAVGVKEKVSVSGWMDREGDGGTFYNMSMSQGGY